MKHSLALTFAGALVLALVAATESVWPDALGATAVSLATAVGALAFAFVLWQQRPLPNRLSMSLGMVFCLYYAASYGFAILGEPPPFSPRLFPQGLDLVHMVAIPVGILAWMAGYQAVRLRSASRAVTRLLVPPSTLRPVNAATLLAVYGSTVLARVYLVVSGAGFGYSRDPDTVISSTSSLQQYLVIYGEFGMVVFGIAVVASRVDVERRGAYRRAYLWVVPAELALRLLAGNKSGLLLLVLTFVLASAATGRSRLGPRQAVTIGIVALLVVFPLVGVYRDLLRPASGPSPSATEAPALAIVAVSRTAEAFADGPGDYASLAFDQTAGRLREVDRAAVSILAHDRGLPYSDPGEMPLRIATGSIPRLFWPGKPLNLYALEVSRNYYGLSNVISASSLSPVGDAYRYGGTPMVILAMALLGAVVRFLDDVLSPRRSIWLLPLLISTIPLIRGGDLAGLVVGLVRYLLIVAVLYRFLFVRTTSRAAPRPTRGGQVGGSRAGSLT